MKNQFTVKRIVQKGNRLSFDYEVTGEWQKYFNLSKKLWIEYSCSIDQVPQSVAVIPLVTNILPIIWLCNAELIVPELDGDFLKGIPNIKKGYMDMYPMLTFAGRLIVGKIVDCKARSGEHTAVFFSGGVDAYTTLLRHMDKEPELLTVWGADIKLENSEGWAKVEHHAKSVARCYGLRYLPIRTNFRQMINDGKLSALVIKSGDGWWHGFQHGIALIGHAAPLAFMQGYKTVYIASSYPEQMKGKYTCASDPTIDNYVHFCGCATVNDGSEWDRQKKVHYLVGKKKAIGTDIQLRVCWESSSGNNCCHCEKCYRTILEIVSEGGNPNEYGFVWDNDDIKRCEKDLKTRIICRQYGVDQYYPAIQSKLQENQSIISNAKQYQWIQKMDFSHFNDYPIKRLRNILPVRVLRILFRRLKQGGKK